MLRYFFSSPDDETAVDEEGQELRNDAVALQRAVASARALAADRESQGQLVVRHRIEVRNDHSETVGGRAFPRRCGHRRDRVKNMVAAVIAILTGTIIGWIGSLAMRTDTQKGILGDIGAGSFSGLVSALALASNYRLDAVLAAALGAILVVGAIALMRRFAERR